MKQQTNSTRKNLRPKSENSVSAVKNHTEKAELKEADKKTIAKVTPKLKKPDLIQSTARIGSKKEKSVSDKTDKQPTKNKATLNKPEVVKSKKLSPAGNQQKEIEVKKKKGADIQKGKPKAQKNMSVTGRLEKPKATKAVVSKKVSLSKTAASKIEKIVIETKNEKLKGRNKLPVGKQIAEPKAQKKAVSGAKVEKPKESKTELIIAVEKNKSQSKTINKKIINKTNVSAKKGKTPEKQIDAIAVKSKARLQKKPAKPISSAIFRGKKEKYDFKVFSLDEKFEDVQAVYIISKRKTDKKKRAHHALICIGATDSIADEIKKHRKGNCLRRNEANVINILPETNERKRLQIETDLKAAHTIACNLK